jgi:amino acid adenylation domain-containing protein
VPTYSTGEIVVGGSGLAWGYAGLPRLTAECFQPDPDAFRPGTRRYLSGDLACMAADGSLLPIGRKDQQLKLRGFRIEAGEVEAALMKIAPITGTIVGLFQRGANLDAGIGLCAHLLVQPDCPLDQTNVFEQLKEQLPDYMIPERMKVIDGFPLTANGKIARDKLPNPFDDSDGTSHELVGAKDPLVRKICEAWSTALALPSVAPSDNYFSLGGDSIRSLKVLSEAEKIGLSISVADLFRYPTPAGLAEAMAGRDTKPSKPSKIQEDTPFYLLSADERAKLPTDAIDAWPASRLQVGMIFHANMADEPTIKGQYIDVFTYKVTQQGTAANLLRAVEGLVEKYPVLRSCFTTATDRLLQIVERFAAPKLELHDFRGLNGDARRKEIDRLHHQLSDDVPDIGAENLFRVVACQHDEEQWTLMFRFHHAILDGWSFALLTSELFARWTDTQPQPSDAAGVFPVSQNAQARFVERELLASNNDALRRRWKKRLAALPTDSLWPWPAESDIAESGRVKIELPTHTAHELSKLAENTELPLKSWLMACAGRAIAWAAGVDASVLGLITSCRPESEDTGDAIGMFLNTLPVVLDGGETWMHAAQRALAAEADVIDDRMLPLSELVRMAERRPFMASFNFVHFRPTETATVHTVADAERSRETTDIDLAITFSLSPDGSRLHGEISYGAQIPKVQASHIAAALSETIGNAIQQSNGPAFVQPHVPGDKSQLLTAPAHDWLSPVHCRVIDSLAKNPETLRVIDLDGKSYSGKAVLERVAAAKVFFEVAQLRPGQGVVLNLPRGADFLACLLAVGLLGGWTVTLDPDAPTSRADLVIADIPDAIIVSRDANYSAQNRLSLAPGALEKHFDQSPQALAAEILSDVISHPSLPAYAIYTSGSTGQPKGVIIDHANLANHMDWMIKAFEFSETDRFLFRTKPSFDASIWEIWAPLLTGAPLIIADDMIALDCNKLAELVEKQKITRLQLVPSLLDIFLMGIERTQLKMLRTLFVGGEAFPNDLAKQSADLGNFDVVNLYGPTETTIHAATHYYTSQHAFKGLSSVPIGKPVDGVYLSVENSSGRQTPIGALGSLFIGGASVGQGYANLPRLTAERYLPDPAHQGQRRFDSRDQVRILPDSSLLFVGRVDDQVKLGGNRIELGDIEAALRMILPNCRNAVLLENTSVIPRLVAYLEDLPDIHVKIDGEDIRAGLAERLPRYMIPAHYRIVRDWPILSSGKTDRRNLPNQAMDRNQNNLQTTADIEGPHSDVIGTLLTMACDQLGTTVTANDDFFAQGADSIMVMQLVSRARSLGLVFTPRDVFTARTMLNLASLVKNADYRQKATQQGTKGLSPAQEWFFTRDLENPDWWNQVVALELLTYVERQNFIQVCEKIAKRHPAFAERFTSDGHQDGGAPQPLVSTIQVTAGQQDYSDEWWQEIERVQAEEINIATGPLWAVVLECGDGDRVRNVALIIHHLIIDGLSWRTLFDELRDGLAGKNLSEGISRSWLWLDPEREDIRNLQLPYWRQQAEIIANHNLPTVLSSESQSIAHRLVISIDCTRSLIKGDTQSPENMEASLCAAVLSALHASNKTGTQCVAVERHGRDRLPENAVDTIGWFTALWPMVLETSNDSSALRLDVCQQLLLLRDFDVDWFAACQLDATLSTVIEPFIVVNFLGSFSASFTDVSFRPLAEMKTSMRAPLNQRTSVLEISALIEDDQLIISISADRQFLKPWEILGFSDAMEQSLASLSEATPPIPADHPLVALDWPGQKLSSLMELSTRGNGTDVILPLTPAQEGILFQQHLNRNSDGIYNQQVSLVVDGVMDEKNLARAFERLLERHEALRTCFVEDVDGYQVQLVKEKAILPIKRIDLPEDEADAKLEWAAIISDDECIPFDERRAPLSRLTVGRQGKRWHLLWSHHHAILDGWSLPILLHELELPEQEWAQLPLPVTRAPFWKWLATQRHPGRQRARSDAWRKRFAGMDHATLAGAQLGQRNGSTKNNRHKSHVSKDASHQLRNFAQQSGVTVAALVQAAFGMVLASLTYQSDLAIGVVQSGRPPEVIGANDWVGMFMNTLPLRITVTPSQPLNEWLAEIQDQVLENQTAVADGLADIQAWVGLGALFDAIVIFQNYPLRGAADYMQNGSRIVDFSLAERNEFALSLYVTESEGLDFELCAGAGGPSTVLLEATARSLHHVLSQWLKDSTQPLCATSVTATKDIAALHNWGEKEKAAAPDTALWSAIERVIASSPQKKAITDPTGPSKTYGELSQVIRSVEAQIRSANLAREEVVAVLGENGVATIATLLACWRNGLAFMPIDPTLPFQRVAMMVEAAHPRLLIDTRRNVSLLPDSMGIPVIRIDANDLQDGIATTGIENSIPHAGTQLAYVMFTSGSTGRPKGVQVSRSALANAIFSFATDPGICASDVLISVTTPSFDISLVEMFCPLIVGAHAYILDEMSVRDGREIAHVLRREKASLMQATPATWKLLINEGSFPGLRAWSGGEALSVDLMQHLDNAVAGVWNFYGPTETTIWSAVGKMTDGPVHVGGPVAGTNLFIVDPRGHMVPPGAIGELMIAGEGVSRGYRHDPRQTAQAFTPIDGGSRAYHTGDLARWNAEKLEILGRTDRQIKIMGHRIEPGEIETALRRSPLIVDAAAGITKDARLIAWFVPKEEGAPIQIEEHLAGLLPAYMIPAECIEISALPLTANGKVDTSALLALMPASLGSSPVKGSADEDPIVRFVALACGLTIKNQTVAFDQDFMASGGHSLHLMQLRTRLEKLTGQEIALGDLFIAGTPRRMAASIIADSPNAEEIRQRASIIIAQLENR